MERIIEHIERLLLLHDCVIIPDFGGFVLQSIPADHHEDTHIFTPSRKEIVYNPTLTHNDGLLIESYMQRYLLDFAKAQSLVKKDVSEIREKLDENAVLQLGAVGKFFKEEERLIFKPSKQSNELFGIWSYGLPVFNFLPLIARDAITISSVVTSEPKIDFEPEKLAPRGKNVIYSIPVTKTFLRIAGATAAAILLFLLMATPVNDVNKSSYSASFIPHEIMPKKTAEDFSTEVLSKYNGMTYSGGQITSVTASDNDTREKNSPEADKSATNPNAEAHTSSSEAVHSSPLPSKTASSTSPRPASITVKTTPTSSTKAPAESVNYYVIVGSFKTKEQALKHLNGLKGINTSASGIVIKDGHFRVYAQAFATEKDAKSYLAKLNQPAWIFKDP